MFPVIGGVYFFGLKALLLVLTCAAAAAAAEAACQLLRGLKPDISDGSAIVTGVILALVIPPSFPLWGGALGAFFSICVVKHIFGGLGKNIFNPALMGRAFLSAAFPILITTYAITPRNIPIIDQSNRVEVQTGATPLSQIKFENRSYENKNMLNFFLGQKKGSTGETSGALILLGFLVLLVTGTADWRLPLSYFSSVFLISGTFWLFDPAANPNPVMSLMLGGILIGGTFMVTDPVTTPVTVKGKWVFGLGAGLLTVLIRKLSGYPEGVMFSILLMNAVTPLINRYTKPAIYGT